MKVVLANIEFNVREIINQPDVYLVNTIVEDLTYKDRTYDTSIKIWLDDKEKFTCYTFNNDLRCNALLDKTVKHWLISEGYEKVKKYFNTCKKIKKYDL